jgi:hypothetical protein
VVSKGGIHRVIPPTAVPKFDDIAPVSLELADNGFQPGWRIVVTRGQLEQKTSHIRAKEIGDIPKVLDQFLRALKPFGMRDMFTDFHGINKTAFGRLSAP